MLVPGNVGCWRGAKPSQPPVARLGRLLEPGSHYAADRVIEAHVYDRVRKFPRQASQDAAAKHRPPFTMTAASATWRPATAPLPPKASSREPVVKPVGKPDAANPHVRLDERGRETEPLAMPQRHRALPQLDW